MENHTKCIFSHTLKLQGMLNTLHKVENHENHARWMHLITVLYTVRSTVCEKMVHFDGIIHEQGILKREILDKAGTSCCHLSIDKCYILGGKKLKKLCKCPFIVTYPTCVVIKCDAKQDNYEMLKLALGEINNKIKREDTDKQATFLYNYWLTKIC